MRAFWWIVLGLIGSALIGMAGCATAQPTVGVCSIAAPDWPGARSDYDRAATLAALGSLKQAVESDRSAAHVGRRDGVGVQADQLFRAAPSSTGYVSHGALELATRLRQLDCAVRRGGVAPADAEHRYDTILVEVDAERLILGWTPPSTVAAGATPSRGGEIR